MTNLIGSDVDDYYGAWLTKPGANRSHL